MDKKSGKNQKKQGTVQKVAQKEEMIPKDQNSLL